MLSDVKMRNEQIEYAIQKATHGSVADLNVVDHGAEVELHGCCASFTCKKLAQDVAHPFIGDSRLVNQIEVR